MLNEYILQNWALILVLLAFAISLTETIFLDRVTIRRMYTLIVTIFVLSSLVFLEFYYADLGTHTAARTVLMAIRYSATPFIIAQVIYSLNTKIRWIVFIPAIILAAVDFISIPTGIVFSLGENGRLMRGPLGYLPFIMVGVYAAVLIVTLVKNSNKRSMEIVPIAFLGLALGAGLLLPFVLGCAFSRIFCTPIAIALFVYYVFLILQLTKKDSLTGLLNRQAFYADIANDPGSITALLSIDMNGLKAVNDTKGHAVGDEALTALAGCFARALGRRESAYRTGGDEFVVVCRQTDRFEVERLVERIRRNVAETPYSCSVGYSFCADGSKSPDELLKESDAMMYAEKALFHKNA